MTLISSLETTNIQKVFTEETHRGCTPRETCDRMKGIFPLVGITRVANVTGLDTLGIPVYVAYRPNSRSLSVSQGKGYTPDAARASAIMESIESWHAENIHLPLRLCSYNEIYFRDNCIDVSRLPRLKGKNYTAHDRVLWIEGTDLFTREKKWLPFEAVHSDYRSPLPAGSGFFISSSNGLSSGNNYHESIIHGICEVIERDALTIWSLKENAEQNASKIDPATVDDPRCRDIIERFHGAGLHVGIWDITSNAGVPAFLCRILPQLEPDITGLRPASGMGCHLSKNIALLRALTEAAQSRLSFISGARDDLDRAGYLKTLTHAEYQVWHDILTTAAFADFRSVATLSAGTFDQDLSRLLQRLAAIGITEAVAVDLTKEELGIPVTKIVIPGLESFLAETNLLLGTRAGRILTKGDAHG